MKACTIKILVFHNFFTVAQQISYEHNKSVFPFFSWSMYNEYVIMAKVLQI